VAAKSSSQDNTGAGDHGVGANPDRADVRVSSAVRPEKSTQSTALMFWQLRQISGERRNP
jgi:hypothetical protein